LTRHFLLAPLSNYGYLGYDASFHLAEECSNAAIATPRSIIMTALSGSILGFFLNVIIAYTITDVTAAMESDLVSQ
jgi:amino acid transporter